jgi:predicted RNA binding protein YcfA (HicA-like mRNA interferase family)
MNLSPRHLIKLLEENGFIFKRSKGSHRLYYNPINNKTAIVTFHGGRDLKKGTFLAILRQAGIDKNETE